MTTLTRRTLLKGAAVCAGALAAPGVVRTAYAADWTGGVLVTVSLRGGVDGLSLVAPVGDPDYARLRPTIAVPASTGLPTGDRLFVLHPSLAPLKPLWDAGTLGAVHAVGSPDGSRSHFAATEALERAAPGTSIRTGWLDRVLTGSTGTFSTAPFSAVRIGSGSPGMLLTGPAPEVATRSLETMVLASSDWVGPRLTTALSALHAGPAGEPSARGALSALATAATVVAADAVPRATYPDTALGRALADVARLVRAGQGLQAACVDLGDWDMHSGLGAAGGGWMAEQARQLAEALAAFAADLGPDLDRVTVLTLSEFGRRVAENGSGGVDHGFGGAMLVMGGGLAGGRVHGRWPGLGADALDHGDLAGTTDFRSVVAELLVHRGTSRSALASVFPGFTPTAVGLVA